mgnify:CR=1 FL=1
MTAKSLLTALLPLVSDLSRELPEGERYRRLLEAMRALLPCDAAALLRLDGEWLVPLAVDGLSTDTLGRRFKVSEHPRFEALLSSNGPTRFAADSDLPDPYDGLVDGLDEHLEVHDCLGCPLFVDEKLWGLITLDALDPERFEPIELDALQAFASLASATVNAAERIQRLANRAEDEHQRAEVYRQASGQQHREMIGQSKALKKLVEEINLVGGSDLTVLITGETGVGKELVAQALHQASQRPVSLQRPTSAKPSKSSSPPPSMPVVMTSQRARSSCNVTRSTAPAQKSAPAQRSARRFMPISTFRCLARKRWNPPSRSGERLLISSCSHSRLTERPMLGLVM